MIYTVYAKDEVDALQYGLPIRASSQHQMRVLALYDKQRKAINLVQPKTWPNSIKVEYCDGPRVKDADTGQWLGTDAHLYTLLDYNGEVLAVYSIDDYNRLTTIQRP